MSSTGLTGKKFIGKIVKGQDPEQRGRYYVHIPELQPHMAETSGILCTNSIHSNRVSSSSNGCFGSYTPLHPDTLVQVECLTDDISSLRILAVVSDDQPKSDMSPGKILGVEPSGKIIQVKVDGFENEVTDPTKLKGQINGILNSGNEQAMSLLGSIKDKLGNMFDWISKGFKDILGNIPGINKSANGMNISLPLSADAFDISAVKKEFENLKSISNENLKIDSSKIAEVTGESISSASSKISVKEHLGNISDPSKYHS